MTSAEAQAEFEAQPVLQPGEEGWWRVWGAQPRHIRAGDLVMCKGADSGEVEYHLVEELFTAKASPMRIGFISDGVQSTIGALTPMFLLRRGTKNTLASP